MELTRRQLLAGAGATTLAAVGIYELAERAGRAPSRPVVTARPPEQHVLGGLRVVTDNNVEVVVPPQHHEMVTFRLPGGGRPGSEGRDVCAGAPSTIIAAGKTIEHEANAEPSNKD